MAHQLVDQLPENATGENLMHQMYVREAIADRSIEQKAVPAVAQADAIHIAVAAIQRID